jgi:DNA-binding CsgD family transcriptional regulator
VTSRDTRWVLDVVEAAYRTRTSLSSWLDGVFEAARPALEADMGFTGSTFAWRDGELTFGAMVHAGDLPPIVRDIFLRGADHLSAEERAIAHGPRPRALESMDSLMRKAIGDRGFGDGASFEGLRQAGVSDMVAAYGLDPSGHGYVLTSPRRRRAELSKVDLARWTRLRAHLLAGLRLHTRAGTTEAVLDPGGKVLHAEQPAKGPSARAALREAAVRMDRARTRSGRQAPDAALDAWEGLVSGRWSLVDSFDRDGRRFLVARRNDPALCQPRPLSRRERQVLAYAALGRSNKEIAYELGLAPSTVSTYLTSAMQRLGLSCRAVLTDLWSTCTEGAPHGR